MSLLLMLTPFSTVLAAEGAVPEPTEVAISVEAAVIFALVVVVGFLAHAVAGLKRRLRVVEHIVLGDAGPAVHPASAAPAIAPASGAPGEAPAHAPVDPLVFAAIAAAVHVVLGRPARVVAVDEAANDQTRVWSLEGRRQIFHSHRVR